MDFRIAIVDFLGKAKEGKVGGDVYKYQIGTEAGTLGTWNPAVPEEVKAEVEQIIKDLRSGNLTL